MSKKILAPISQAEIEARISGHQDELLGSTLPFSTIPDGPAATAG
jgi:hypothetical protein